MNIAVKSIIIAVAVFMMMPHCFATQTGFGGTSGGTSVSSTNTMALGPDSGFQSSQALSVSGSAVMVSTTELSGGPGEWVNQYHQADSGSYHASAYAYMDPTKVTQFTYSCNPSTTQSSASIKQHVNAGNARDLVYGGYAYNQKDYAAVQVSGEADLIDYYNELYAGKTKVSAWQSFTGTGLNLIALSWAENGNLKGEAPDHTWFDALNNTGGFTSFNPGPMTFGATYGVSTLQAAYFGNAEITSPYSSQAKVESGKATSGQDSVVQSADFAAFGGAAAKGTLAKTDANGFSSDTSISISGAAAEDATGLRYSGSASSESKSQSTNQRLDAESDDWIGALSLAGRLNAVYDSNSETATAVAHLAGQGGYLEDAITGNNGIKTSAYVADKEAGASQSADVGSADQAIFAGLAGAINGCLDDGIIKGEVLGAVTGVQVEDNYGSITYSANSKVNAASRIKSGSASASQALKAEATEGVNALSGAAYLNLGRLNIDSLDISDLDTVDISVPSIYGSGQYAALYETLWGKKGYSSSASIDGSGATSKQDADVASAPYGTFGGLSAAASGSHDDSGIINAELLGAVSGVTFENDITGTPITYSASSRVNTASQVSRSSASASQSVTNVDTTDEMNALSGAAYLKAANLDIANLLTDGTINGYGSAQFATLEDDATWGKKGYTSSASVDGSAASSKQNADISSAEHGMFYGGFLAGSYNNAGDIANGWILDGVAAASVESGKTISYSGSSKVTSATKASAVAGSASQTLNAQSSDYAGTRTYADLNSVTNWDSVKNTGTMTSYSIGGESDLSGASMGKGGLQSKVDIADGAAPTFTQSADVVSADEGSFDGGLSFNGIKSTDSTLDHQSFESDYGAGFSDGKGITYSSKSSIESPLKVSSTSVSAEQTLNFKSVSGAGKGASVSASRDLGDIASSFDYNADCSASVESVPMASASISGTDAVSATGKQAKASQSLTAAGNEINRHLEAGETNSSGTVYFVDAQSTIITEDAKNGKLNTLSGSSTATVNVGSGATLNGKWTGYVAQDLVYNPGHINFGRYVEARNYRGDNKNVIETLYSYSGGFTKSFTESASVTDKTASAA